MSEASCEKICNQELINNMKTALAMQEVPDDGNVYEKLRITHLKAFTCKKCKRDISYRMTERKLEEYLKYAVCVDCITT
jgi:hypothetical protein